MNKTSKKLLSVIIFLTFCFASACRADGLGDYIFGLFDSASFAYALVAVAFAGLALNQMRWLMAERMRKKSLEIFNTLPVNTYIFDADGNILHSYTSYRELVAAKHISEFGEDFFKTFKRGVDDIVTGKQVSIEYSFNGDHRSGIVKRLSGQAFGENTFLLSTMDVTELENARRSLEKTQTRLSDLNQSLNMIIENIPCCVFVKNHSAGGVYVLANKYFSTNLGVDPNAIVGRRDSDIFPKYAKAYEGDDRDVVAAGGMREIEESVTHPGDGSQHVYRTLKTSSKMANGDIYLFGVSIDITEIVENQKRTKAYSEQMEVLNECLSRAMLSIDFKNTVNDMLKLVGGSMGASRCCFSSYDAGSNALPAVYEWRAEGVKPRNLSEISDMPRDGLKLWADTLSRRRIVKSDDVAADPLPVFAYFNKMTDASDTKSMLAVGIGEAEKMLGFMSIEFSAAGRKISDADERFARAVVRIFELVIERFANLKAVEDGLRNRKLILDSIGIPVLLLDSDRNIISANKAVEKFTGVTFEQMQSRPCHESICKGFYNDDTCPVLQSIRTKKVVANEFTGANDFSEHGGKDYQVTMTPILDAAGECTHVVESVIDLTEFNKSRAQLYKAMQEAQAADKAKSSFIATMSHELRTPLNAVIGYSELTQDESLPPNERTRNLKNINFAANTLLSLINDILDLSKLEADQVEIVPSPLDIGDISDEFLSIFKFAAGKKNIGLKAEVSKGTPILMLDILRFKQILMNLVGNAIKFTSQGCVTIRFDFEKTAEGRGDLHMRVSDTGAGIGEDFLKKIFNPFEQESHKRVRGRGAYEGTGLGLSIVKRLVTKMGGEIDISSRKDVGTDVSVVIRDVEVSSISMEDYVRHKTSGAHAEVTHEANFSGMTILAVDDILLNVKVLKSMLAALGAEVVETLSGEEALKICQTRKIDLVMTDLWMPKMNGEELARNLRGDGLTRDIPIIAVTADTQLQDPESLFDAALFKPITKKAIADVLVRILKP